jgi:hypothetical protein
MLDELEWAQVSPFLDNAIEQIKRYRTEHNVSLSEAKQHGYGQEALTRYFEIAGFREANANALWHHRLSLFGPPCSNCGKPLRTPQARHCAECGAPRANTDSGHVSEPAAPPS